MSISLLREEQSRHYREKQARQQLLGKHPRRGFWPRRNTI